MNTRAKLHNAMREILDGAEIADALEPFDAAEASMLLDLSEDDWIYIADSALGAGPALDLLKIVERERDELERLLRDRAET